jgi:hypothetical protein
MKPFLTHVSILVLLLPMNSDSAHSAATECNEQSKNFISQGDKYYDLPEVKPLTKKQIAQVKRIFSRTKKKLKGNGTAILCEGPENDIEVEIDKETVTAMFNVTDKGRIIIELEIYNIDNKSTHSEKLQYLGDKDNYSIQAMDKTGVQIVSKWRGQRRSRTTPLNERLVTIAVEHGVLIIDIEHYYNGHFAYAFYRTLK